MVWTHAGVALEDLLPVGNSHKISSGKTASRGREPLLEQGKIMTMKERQMTQCYGLIATAILLCHSGGGGRRGWTGGGSRAYHFSLL